jgi:CubicO group peptidase (beta-lactamase class C family)
MHFFDQPLSVTTLTFLAASVTSRRAREKWRLEAADKAGATRLDNLLQAAVEAKSVPSVVAMVADPGGVVYRRAVNINENTIFAIASMTKPVTSVAVMQLVESGKVRLDEPASAYVPDLARLQVLEGGVPRSPKSPVTVRQLLAHTSGFAYEFMNRDLAGHVKTGKTASMMAGGDAFLKAPLMFDPGTRWEYGISTDWLGKVVEAVSGEPLDRYFQHHIFEPLEMRDSYFQVPAEKQARLASVYRRNPDGTLEKQPASPFKPGAYLSGGGGLFSTAADYIRFARAIMAGGQLGGRRILNAESVRIMGTNQIGELTIRPFPTMVPALMVDGAMLPGALDKFGLGFALNSVAVENGRGANTMSWAGIFNTFFWIDRQKKICAVLMTQMSPGLDAGPRKVLEDFDRAVYSWQRE